MPTLPMKPFFSLFGALFFLGLAAPAQAQIQVQTTGALCTKICVALIQSVGDDVKEQIALSCVQTTGLCSAEGYFQTGEERVPVTIEGGLVGTTLTLRIRAADRSFVPEGQDAIVMPIDPGLVQQAAQFIVVNGLVEGTPFARSGTPVAVTVMVQRLADR